jgi:hypothetical protein
MKSIRYILLCVLAIASAFSSKAEFRYGVQAGVGLTTLDFKQDLVNVSSVVGPRAGVDAELMFPGIGFGLRLGAIYAMQGASVDLGSRTIWAADGYGKERLMLHTLEIPFNLEFKWTKMNGFEDTLAPFVFGGPVFDFTVAHSSCKAMEYPFGSIGLRAGVGAEIFKRWQVCGSYTWGMTYVTKATKLENYSARNKYWAVTATYFF